MPTIESDNQKRENRDMLRAFFYAGPAEITLYFITSLALLASLNAQALAFYISGVTPNSTDSLGRFINEKLSGFLAQGRLANLIFWAVMGIITYLLFWLIKNVYINIHNDIVNDAFRHPSGYNRLGYWRGVVGLKGVLVLALIVLGIYIYLLAFILPVISHQFYLALVGTKWLYQVPVLLFTVTVGAAAVYLLSKIILTIVNAWRSIVSGF